MSPHPKTARKPGRRPVACPEQATGPASFSNDSARPLGKGYSEIMQMVLSYAAAGKTAGNPTLSHSLERFCAMPDLGRHLAALPREPLCLIQGYSTPGNAGALAQFIRKFAKARPRIETVDLYDLPHLYAVLDLEMPPMIYHIADAAHLERLYQDHTVDIVVEDFLLNCIPASKHEPLLREVSRVLKPGGVGIISFTSSETLDIDSALATTKLQAGHKFAWDAEAYDLSDMEKRNKSGEPLDYLKGRLVYHQPTSEFIYVAKAGGRFEFFRSPVEIFSLFKMCGLNLLSFDVSRGTDDHGLCCTRYRCLLARQSLS